MGGLSRLGISVFFDTSIHLIMNGYGPKVLGKKKKKGKRRSLPTPHRPNWYIRPHVTTNRGPGPQCPSVWQQDRIKGAAQNIAAVIEIHLQRSENFRKSGYLHSKMTVGAWAPSNIYLVFLCYPFIPIRVTLLRCYTSWWHWLYVKPVPSIVLRVVPAFPWSALLLCIHTKSWRY